MPITLGILAQSRQVVDTGAFQLLESTVLTGNQTSVTFSNINTNYGSTYKHLQLRVVTRDTFTGGSGSTVFIRYNSDSGNNYAFHSLQGNGSSVTSSASSSTNRIVYQQSANGNFSAQVIDILDAFSTTKNKTTRILDSAPTVPYVGLLSGLYMSTSAINTILLQTEGFNLATGSRFSLYGVKATA
jgi:hypothetical protein